MNPFKAIINVFADPIPDERHGEIVSQCAPQGRGSSLTGWRPQTATRRQQITARPQQQQLQYLPQHQHRRIHSGRLRNVLKGRKQKRIGASEALQLGMSRQEILDAEWVEVDSNEIDIFIDNR